MVSPRALAREVPDELWHKVEILYTSFATPLPFPEQAPHLQWVQLYSAGADRIVGSPLFHTSVVFTSASGVHAVSVAEYVLTMVLAWFHHVPRLREQQRLAQWPSDSERTSLFVAEELRRKTVGIVGYGSIGRQVARLADAFGMRVLAIQRGADHRDSGFLFRGVGDPEGTLPDRYYTPDQLHQMLSESDVVLIAAPLTGETKGLFDFAAFEAMKRTAFLVNIARSEICDEPALVAALRDHRIAGAALDVFHREPLPPEHPLWRFPNVFISPHIAGISPEYDRRAAIIFEENLRRYLANEPLQNIVEKIQGY
jgi:phosphoglycerate dehydrogenase-like enzyme